MLRLVVVRALTVRVLRTPWAHDVPGSRQTRGYFDANRFRSGHASGEERKCSAVALLVAVSCITEPCAGLFSDEAETGF